MFFLNRQVFLALTVFLSLGFSSARAWIYDPGKPLIYEMRIAFETDKWINMYSTATVLSKSENSEAFRVVANSTVTPTYQLLVTTQGNVGIGTANPAYGLDVEKTTGGTYVKLGSAHPLYMIDTPAWGFNLYYKDGFKFGKGSSSSYGALVEGHSATGNINFYTTNSGSADGDASLTNRLTIQNDGNVGVGTAVPGKKLDVAGDVNASGTVYGSGSVIQVKMATLDGSGSSSLSFSDLGVWHHITQVAITPKRSDSTLYAVATVNGLDNGGNGRLAVMLVHDTTSGGTSGTAVGGAYVAQDSSWTTGTSSASMLAYVAPGSTDARYFKILACKHDVATTWYVNNWSYTSVMVMEVSP